MKVKRENDLYRVTIPASRRDDSLTMAREALNTLFEKVNKNKKNYTVKNINIGWYDCFAKIEVIAEIKMEGKNG